MPNVDQVTVEQFSRRQWAENHKGFRYFAEHQDYGSPTSHDTLIGDSWFYDTIVRDRYKIDPQDKVVCEIGVGYGRLSANFKTAKHIYGIDVSEELFETTEKYLELKGFSRDRFDLFLADQYQETIPKGGDLVFSFIVFQHIPKTFQVDYLNFFSQWLNPGGELLIQFMVGDIECYPMNQEPSFFWAVPELFRVIQGLPLTIQHFDVNLVVPGCPPYYWAWVHLSKGT